MASKEEEERRTKEELSFVWRDIEFDIVYLALGDFDMCLSVFVILIRCVYLSLAMVDHSRWAEDS